MASKKPETPSSISGYTVLPVRLQVLASFKEAAIHYLYLRRHEPKIPTPDDARTLFAVNIPFDATEAHFRYLFSHIGGGRVDSVKFLGNRRTLTDVRQPIAPPPKGSKKRKRDRIKQEDGAASALPEIWDRGLHPSGSTALIVFVDDGSLDATMKALKRHSKGKLAIWGEGVEGEKVPALGSQRYLTHQTLRYPPSSALQSSIDAFLTAYANTEAARARHLARKRQEPDEDGFITVVRGGRTGPARHQEAAAAADRQKGKGEYRDFYRFQLREERKKNVGELVRRFEEDKRKVEEMKGRRGKFKPQ
ncbi:MAG: Ribosomal RNA-processing protein 7 [Geoglossum umbratile]|nr:MAG: Ribosomal RNA-processing protein 7 [Geoglossum umbratile]